MYSRASLVLLSGLLFTACGIDAGIPVPNTVDFEENLSAYKIYQGDMGSLNPSDDYQLLELKSPLYSNYSLKQRLVRQARASCLRARSALFACLLQR